MTGLHQARQLLPQTGLDSPDACTLTGPSSLNMPGATLGPCPRLSNEVCVQGSLSTTGAHVGTWPLPWEPGPILSALLPLWTPGPQALTGLSPGLGVPSPEMPGTPQWPKSLRVEVSRATSWQPVEEAAPPPEPAIALSLHTPACPVPLHTHLAPTLRSLEGAF